MLLVKQEFALNKRLYRLSKGEPYISAVIEDIGKATYQVTLFYFNSYEMVNGKPVLKREVIEKIESIDVNRVAGKKLRKKVAFNCELEGTEEELLALSKKIHVLYDINEYKTIFGNKTGRRIYRKEA